MIRILRKHRQWLMIVIAVLSIPFVFYFVQKPDYSLAFRNSAIGHIYSRPVTQNEFDRNYLLFRLSSLLGMTLGSDLMINNVSNENEMYVEFMWNRLVLRHEAERLGIQPSQSEITDYVKTLPRFQGDAGFDIEKFNEFTKENLPPLGFNETQIEELASDQLSLNKMKGLLAVDNAVPESEMKDNYERAYGKLYIAAVHLQVEDFRKDVTISDEDISKYYDSHKDQLKSDEERTVQFVSFTLSTDEKKLKGKERIDALQKLADKANDFSVALQEKGAEFADVAAKFDAPVVTPEEFTATKPPLEFVDNPQLTQAAFQIPQENPISDPVQTSDGFYIMHLLTVTESKALDLDGAKTKILEALTDERVRQFVTAKATEVAQQMRNALKTKAPLDLAISRTKLKLSPWWPPELAASFGLDRATQPSGIKLEQYPPFSLVETATKPEEEMEPNFSSPDFPTMRTTVAGLQPGDVSDFVPAADGGYVIALEKRDPADPAGFAAAKEKYEKGNENSQRRIAFAEWIRERRKSSGATTG